MPENIPQININVDDKGNYWLFSIADNGIGMEDRHLKKIFDVFQILHGKSQYPGTGIGLSICKKIITRHDGKIWVTSKKGVGYTFYFTVQKK